MELINSTRMVAGYTLGLQPGGREMLVAVVKGTFRISEERGATLGLHENQAPLVMSDVFHGEPGLSAPKYEADFAPCKQRCDVLVNGTAYAPGGEPTERCTVGVRIGGWQKAFSVVGDRRWSSAGGVSVTPAQPFSTMPISYDRAFGGSDLRHEDMAQHASFAANPSGRGFHRHLVDEWLHGSPLPNTEEISAPVTSPQGDYRPMAFGPVGRHWAPRIGHAGTYDQAWLEDVFPFLPADFDTLYYQAAPADQQMPQPQDDQAVTLLNLTPEGRCEFVLPHLALPIQIVPKNAPRENLLAQPDTILIEPDARRAMVTWRVSRPLRRNLFEIAQVLVGHNGSEWWQRREADVQPAVVPRKSVELAAQELR